MAHIAKCMDCWSEFNGDIVRTCGICGSDRFTYRDVPSPPRPTWDEYFFGLADAASTRGTCPRARIGVILVKDNLVVGTGFNGAPSGEDHCDDVGCEMFADHCVRAVHAEDNAIKNAVADPTGSTAYVYGPRPVCSHCARLLHAAGVRDVKHKEA